MKACLYLSAIVMLFGLWSCDSAIPGCTDQNAENHNPLADEDDGTCSYRGSAVFYHGESTSVNLVSDGITNVKLYVDGVFWDAMSPNVFFSSEPTCSSPDAMNMENYGIGQSLSQTFDYSITDQDENVLANGIFEITGNGCTAIEYMY